MPHGCWRFARGKPVDAYELEPSVLSYAAFQSREALRAWYARKREYEQQHAGTDAPRNGASADAEPDLTRHLRAGTRRDS